MREFMSCTTSAPPAFRSVPISLYRADYVNAVATSHCMTYKCHISVRQVPDKIIGVVAVCDLMTQACQERKACLIQKAKAKEEDHGYDGHDAHLAEVLVKR